MTRDCKLASCASKLKVTETRDRRREQWLVLVIDFIFIIIIIYIQKYLPMTIASSESLQVIYKAASYNFQEVHNLLKFSAKYEFLKSIKIQCGKVLYNSSTGESHWSNIVEDGEQLENTTIVCTWYFLTELSSSWNIQKYTMMCWCDKDTLTEPLLLTHSFRNIKIFLHKITNPIIPTEIINWRYY